MKVLVTGSEGFIAKNLLVRLFEEKISYDQYSHGDSVESLKNKLKTVDFVIHLAGVNRPEKPEEFALGNADLTKTLCDIIVDENLQLPIIYSSSIQALIDNPYGRSKKAAEKHLENYSLASSAPVYCFRFPNVFGKWSRPNYNSAVATFCYNTVHNLPIKVNDPDAMINLVYIDDVVERFISLLRSQSLLTSFELSQVSPVYQITVGALKTQLDIFKNSRTTGIIEPVGTDLTRALYSTYLSYLQPTDFHYPLVKHEDPRGVFVEILKTKTSGQFSFFTAHPGITRGGHYHHSKNEKFLVIKGTAQFRFRHIITNDFYELRTSGEEPQVVETVPGWSHDITNTGDGDMVVMLWANEIFDPEKPDTINYKV